MKSQILSDELLVTAKTEIKKEYAKSPTEGIHCRNKIKILSAPKQKGINRADLKCIGNRRTRKCGDTDSFERHKKIIGMAQIFSGYRQSANDVNQQRDSYNNYAQH